MPVRSMTGYGRGTAESGAHRVVAEMRSVNHRYLDFKIRGASLGPAIEDRVARVVKKRLARGSVVLSLKVRSQSSAASVRVDLAAARRVLAELRQLEQLGVPGTIDAALLCQQPGVLTHDADADTDESALAECVDRATESCVEALIAMRLSEGQVLRADIESRLDTLVELSESIEELARNAPDDAQKRLQDRLGKLLGNAGVEVEPERLAHEVAVLADRLDVTEELVRIRSHVAQARELLASDGEAIGRRLDFMVQELGRELNTVGSKSQSAEIAASVVAAKAELERIREQVQNVE